MHLMSHELVVEAKSIAGESDVIAASFDLDELTGPGVVLFHKCKSFSIDGKKRVETESVFEIGNEKFLVLLLVVEAENDQVIQLRISDFGLRI